MEKDIDKRIQKLKKKVDKLLNEIQLLERERKKTERKAAFDEILRLGREHDLFVRDEFKELRYASDNPRVKYEFSMIDPDPCLNELSKLLVI